tara:strand:- start:423 stop:638 length:216 start_codon:yes stop_codon:yes gene_type:complete
MKTKYKFKDIKKLRGNGANYYYIKIKENGESKAVWEHCLLREIAGQDYLSFHPEWLPTSKNCINILLPFHY